MGLADSSATILLAVSTARSRSSGPTVDDAEMHVGVPSASSSMHGGGGRRGSMLDGERDPWPVAAAQVKVAVSPGVQITGAPQRPDRPVPAASRSCARGGPGRWRRRCSRWSVRNSPSSARSSRPPSSSSMRCRRTSWIENEQTRGSLLKSGAQSGAIAGHVQAQASRRSISARSSSARPRPRAPRDRLDSIPEGSYRRILRAVDEHRAGRLDLEAPERIGSARHADG